MRLLSLAVVACLTASCGSTPARPTPPIDATLTVSLGEAAVVAPGSLIIRFDTVTEDSRCPTGAYCVWAGRAGARLAVVANASEQSIQLLSDPRASRTATAGDVRVEWVELEPYPSIGAPTQPGTYRLTVRVMR